MIPPEWRGECITVDVDGPIATITLNRPDQRNATNWQMATELAAALGALRSTAAVRVLVLTGGGGDFSVGGDLTAESSTRVMRKETLLEDLNRLELTTDIIARLYHFPVPTIAKIDGACAGAGLSLALATDLRVASDRSVFNTAFVDAGLSGDYGIGWLLTRTVGPAQAKQLLLMPSKIGSYEAQTRGLVHVVSDSPDATADMWARQLAQSPRLAVRFAKQNLHAALADDLTTYLAREMERVAICAHSPDSDEAVAAYLEKRQPEFTGP